MEKKINKYTCADMQNKILKVMTFKILREIAENIKNSGFFSVMADETTDKSNREQVVIVIRHVDTELVAHEDFIGLNMVHSFNRCHDTYSSHQGLPIADEFFFKQL